MSAKVISYLGMTPKLGKDVFIADGAVVIGDAVIGEQSSVWFQSVVRADIAWIRIGKRTNIQDGSVVHVTDGDKGARIGDDVTVGHRCIIHACEVGDRCLIGMGAVLLDDCVIGAGSVVGAGSLVTPRFQAPPGSLILGSPAKVVRPVNEREAGMGLYGARHYLEMSRHYREMDQ